jgi:hypothetical protein
MEKWKNLYGKVQEFIWLNRLFDFNCILSIVFQVQFLGCPGKPNFQFHILSVRGWLYIYIYIYPSYPILSCPVLSCPILSYPILSYPSICYSRFILNWSSLNPWPSAHLQYSAKKEGIEPPQPPDRSCQQLWNYADELTGIPPSAWLNTHPHERIHKEKHDQNLVQTRACANIQIYCGRSSCVPEHGWGRSSCRRKVNVSTFYEFLVVKSRWRLAFHWFLWVILSMLLCASS